MASSSKTPLPETGSSKSGSSKIWTSKIGASKIGASKTRPPQYREASGAPVEFVLEPGSIDEAPIGAEAVGGGIRWDVMMAFYLRLVSALWMVKGLHYWSLVIGLGDLPLSEESQIRQGVIVGFALLDCAAAVGLWLLNGWGKSLWLILVCVEILAAFLLAQSGVPVSSALGALLTMAIFVLLTYVLRRRRRRR